MVVKFSGTVRGDGITGVRFGAGVAQSVVGHLRGALRAAPWAEMLPGCGEYYGQ